MLKLEFDSETREFNPHEGPIDVLKRALNNSAQKYPTAKEQIQATQRSCGPYDLGNSDITSGLSGF